MSYTCVHMIGGHTCVHIICWPFGTLELCQPSKPYGQGKLRNGSQALYFLYVVETTGPRPRPCCKRIKKLALICFHCFLWFCFLRFLLSPVMVSQFLTSSTLWNSHFQLYIIVIMGYFWMSFFVGTSYTGA